MQYHKQTSMTAGTIIHHTHLSLVIWFRAIYLYVNDKRGISTAQLSKTGEKKIPIFLRMHEVPNIQLETSQEFVDAHIQNGATIECDGFKSYIGLKNVAVDAKVYDSAAGDLKWLHKALSNLKAFLAGTYHDRYVNLQSYLNEYCLHFNRRYSTNQLFARLTRAVTLSTLAD